MNGKQKWQLKLHARKLRYGRRDKSGETRWAKEDWEIRKDKDSWLPTGVFHFVASYVLNCVKNASDKSFATLRKSILRGLCEAALACGCAWKLNRARGDVTWFLDGHRFYAFQIEDCHSHAVAKIPDLQALLRKRRSRFEKMEHKSGAMLRGSWLVLKGGYVKLVPGRTRRD